MPTYAFPPQAGQEEDISLQHTPPCTCSQGHTSQMTEAVTWRLSLRYVGFTWIIPCRSFSGRLQTCCPPMYSSAFTRMLNLPWKEGTYRKVSQLCWTTARLDRAQVKREEGMQRRAQPLIHAFPLGPSKDLPLPHG